MEQRKQMLFRSYIVYGMMLLLAILIVSKIVYIQFYEGEKWEKKAKKLFYAYRDVKPIRGNIYSEKGSLLATSVPIYEIRFDAAVESLTDELFYSDVDSLAIGLSNIFRDKSWEAYKLDLVEARKRKDRYYLVKRKVNYLLLKKLKKLPIFRKGKYKGGLIVVQETKRVKPFGYLASRTIGYSKSSVKPVGLEGAYDNYLSGIKGKLLMKRISGGVWMPIDDSEQIEPKDGYDVYTTIDVALQDVAQQSLLKQLQKNNADHGCVILMEVKTGDIKAISNLQRTSGGAYAESYNYAVGETTEPGSVFKLPAIMVALEDGYIDLDDEIDTEDGTTEYYDRIMRDSRLGGYGVLSLKKAFALSSNVAISKVISAAYATKPKEFIQGLKELGISNKLDVEIKGEGSPFIKNVGDKGWSGVTLPWMAIGYETRMTPLQILTFYNAVANDGKSMKPRFVTSIVSREGVVKQIDPIVLHKSICSKNTIQKAKSLLEAVVDSGTAKNLRNSVYKIAGKTGTAQIANKNYGYKYSSKVSYQASFVGYFPSEKPMYSCVAIVNAPSNNVYYGNLVAGPIFRELADKVYAQEFELQKRPSHIQHKAYSRIPYGTNGYAQDLINIYRELKIPIVNLNDQRFSWIKTLTDTSRVTLKPMKTYSNLVPNVKGMGARDAIYALESRGCKVLFKGSGVVKKQSVRPGIKVKSGTIVILELS